MQRHGTPRSDLPKKGTFYFQALAYRRQAIG
jgi:hypothetical protein